MGVAKRKSLSGFDEPLCGIRRIDPQDKNEKRSLWAPRVQKAVMNQGDYCFRGST